MQCNALTILIKIVVFGLSVAVFSIRCASSHSNCYMASPPKSAVLVTGESGLFSSPGLV